MIFFALFTIGLLVGDGYLAEMVWQSPMAVLAKVALTLLLAAFGLSLAAASVATALGGD